MKLWLYLLSGLLLALTGCNIQPTAPEAAAGPPHQVTSAVSSAFPAATMTGTLTSAELNCEMLPQLVVTIDTGANTPTILVFTATAFANVAEAEPDHSFGMQSLRVDGDDDPGVEAYLRFTVAQISGSVRSAKLRLLPFTDTVDGPAVYSTRNTWSPTGITWNNRPERTRRAIDDVEEIRPYTWVEYNVSAIVTGDGTYSFVLATTSDDGVNFYPRRDINPDEVSAGPLDGSTLYPPTVDNPWQLVFCDEFEGTDLDRTKWATKFPWGRDRSSVDELQYYADDAFEFANGVLRIKAEERSIERQEYTSGLISTYETFAPTYGRFEIRAKVPKGQGLWSAFWLLPTTTESRPEIDVFEILGHETDTVHLTNHWQSGSEARKAKEEYTGPDFAQAFHTFAVEWSPTELIWYVDGVERHRSRQGVPTKPMYLLANLAVGGDWPGAPDASTPFPSYFDVDYIRAYQFTSLDDG